MITAAPAKSVPGSGTGGEGSAPLRGAEMLGNPFVLDEAFARLDAALADAAAELYAGEWRAEGSAARIAVDDGTLYIDRLTLHGQDALATLGAQGRIALRAAGGLVAAGGAFFLWRAIA